MKYQHKKLAAGDWEKLSFLEQMASIGSEVERALNWQKKKNADYSRRSSERALELIDLTLSSSRSLAHFKEICIISVLTDYNGSQVLITQNRKNQGGVYPSTV